MVRLLANTGSETITRGYRPVKIVATNPIAPSPVAANAQPPRRVRVRMTARTRTLAVSAAGIAVGTMPRLLLSWATATVQAAMAMPRIAAGTDSRLAAADARTEKSPVVRSTRYIAPCAANMRTTAVPARTVYA